MIETIALDTRKGYSPGGKLRISPLRRGERNNVALSVAVSSDRMPYDLAGMTAHLVWQAADGKLVGPVPMEVTDQAAGTVRCTLPEACYAAAGTARAYIEIRDGAELVDTTDEIFVKVLDCIDADGEQAEEYRPLIGEMRDATDAAVNAAEMAEGAAASAEGAARKAEAAADGADEAAAKAVGAVASVDGEMTLMLGNPTDDDMWLYATGQADGTSGTPALDNASDEDMMGYIGEEA